MKNLPTAGASETTVLWEAVGGQPLGGAMHEMNSRGWRYTAAMNGAISGAHMTRGKRRATLFTKKGRVGMILLSDSQVK